MQTNVHSPVQIFGLPQVLEVPHFQRPYVWTEEEQWEPLWQDVRRVAESRLHDARSTATHFLGAVVVQAHEGQIGTLGRNNLIDGQQRITTLQLLFDAVGALLEEAGHDALAGQLESLTHNHANFVPSGESRLKLEHANRDRGAFVEVMEAEPPVVHGTLKHSGSKIVRAHAFYSEAVAAWLSEPVAEGEPERASALVSALTNGIQFVSITLGAGENSQEIFGTLNARGTPLTAADLIKNLVFQRLELEGVDTRLAHAQEWPFDTDYWEKEISVGRYQMSRSSLFFTQWLGSRLGEEVGTKATFARFKTYVDHDAGTSMSDLLHVIKEQAATYKVWSDAVGEPDRTLTDVEMTVYRMGANDFHVLEPLLLWLHEPGVGYSPEVIARVTSAAESWVMRRLLLRLTSSALGRVVADMIRVHRGMAGDVLPERIENYLARLDVVSTYWPGDEEIRRYLAVAPAYRRFTVARLRTLLEAVENRRRSGTNQPQVPRRGYPIEHVMPQKWEDHWRVDGIEAEVARADHIHRLGNLTLLTSSLNSKVSNGPWTKKRDALQAHDTLLLNSRMLAAAGDEWNERFIDRRGAELVDEFLAIWPVPKGHEGKVSHDRVTASTWIQLRDLVAAGLLVPGAVLTARPGDWGDRRALVMPDGRLDLDGRSFDTPSGAGDFVRGGATNGWTFWNLEDGRRLFDLRTAYLGLSPGESAGGFDWSPLHSILEALAPGHWTTYGNLAAAIGTAPQPLGNHVAHCSQCTNAHRILLSDGTVSTAFAWTDPADTRDPREILEAEGLVFDKGRADPSRSLSADELQELAA